MKIVIAILILLILGSLSWYGYGQWRRGQILDSGRVVLLVDKKEGVYTYSDLLPRDEIRSSLAIVGYADQLSAQAIAEATRGLRLVVGVPVTPGDPRVIQFTPSPTPVAQGAALQAWNRALASLTVQQQDLCAKLSDGSAQQYCLARHLVFLGLQAGIGVETCEPFFVDYQKAECVADMQAQNANRVADADRNGLVDLFEEQAKAPEERVNTLNLPVRPY